MALGKKTSLLVNNQQARSPTSKQAKQYQPAKLISIQPTQDNINPTNSPTN